MADKTNTLKNKIELSGEQQYRQAMNAITSALKEQRSAVKAAVAEYDAADESTRDLSAQEEALSRVYQTQQQKIALISGELDRMVEKTGDQSDESVRLRTALNNARAEMARTSTQLKTLRGQMDDAADGTQDVQTGLEGIGQSAEDAQGQTQGFAQQLQALTGIDLKNLTLATALAAGAAVAAQGIAEGLEIGTEIQESWNQLEALTGATGDNLQMLKDASWDVAAKGAGENLGDVSQSVAEVYQLTDLTGQALSDATYFALGLRDTFGIDVADSAKAASVLMQKFGIDGEHAYDLIATGAQRGANQNGDLADVIAEYAPYFADAGKSADEFIGVLVDGAESGAFSVDKIGDAWKEFMLRIASDEGALEALNALGFSAEDVRAKIAAGGPAADLATAQIVEALSGVGDEVEQNRLGVALFGTQWEDTAGQVLPLFADMDEGLGDVSGAAQNLADVKYDTLDAALSGLKTRIMELAEPTVLMGVNVLIDGLNTLNGIIDAFTDGGFDAGMAAIGEATGSFSDAEKQAMADATAGFQDELMALNEQINAAFASGDTVTAWTLEAQRQQLITAIGTMKEEAVDAVHGVGEGMEEEMAATDMSAAGQTAAQTAVDGVDATQPSMLDAGDELGSAGVIGTQAGLVGMYDAGADGAGGAVGGMRTGISGAYSAGYEMGKAFERGYKAAQRIASPSREMAEAAQYSLDGLFEPMDDGVQQIYARGAALADALREGYAQGASTGASAGTEGGEPAWDGGLPMAIAQAVKEAVSGLVLVANDQTLGRVAAAGASREISRIAQSTLAGQINSVKGW